MATISPQHRIIIGQTYTNVKAELFSIFRQACIAEDVCEDLVHDVFLKIMSLDIIVESQLKALAVRIAYQKRTDYLRHRTFINKVQNDGWWQMERIYSHTQAEVDDILQTEMRAIRCMSELDSKVYEMSRFEEKTAEEITIELHLTRRAIEGRLYRTRSLVRERVRRMINY